MKKNGKYYTICFRPLKRKLTGGWWNIIHLLTFKLKVEQLIFKKQLEHFWDDSIDPLNLSILQAPTVITTGLVSEGVKIFQFVTPPSHPLNKNYTKYLQCVKYYWTLTHMGIDKMIQCDIHDSQQI